MQDINTKTRFACPCVVLRVTYVFWSFPLSFRVSSMRLSRFAGLQPLRRLLSTATTTTAAGATPVVNRTQYSAKAGALTTTIQLKRSLPLANGGALPSVDINYARFGNPTKPIVYVMPSMSHSALVTGNPEWVLPEPNPADPRPNPAIVTTTKHADRTPPRDGREREKGWWEHTVGAGSDFGIDLNEFHVICASPLGAPYGSSSPVTVSPLSGQLYRNTFPLITPADQARAHSYLMDHFGIKRVHAIVGSSMGGMQVLQFARLFPDRYSRVVACCTTARTSPSTVALRAVQRSAVMMDAKYRGGLYPMEDGPQDGMGVARKFGTICYRSREEFDTRFGWTAKPSTPDQPSGAGSAGSGGGEFEIESYLSHQASTFQTRYDANCYLVLSRCMDRMDIGAGAESYEAGAKQIPRDKQLLLLSVAQDALIPAKEMEQLASVLGSAGHTVHYESLHSMHGHDAFLVRSERELFNSRISHFLNHTVSDGVQSVRSYVTSLSNH